MYGDAMARSCAGTPADAALAGTPLAAKAAKKTAAEYPFACFRLAIARPFAAVKLTLTPVTVFPSPVNAPVVASR
jgi:hypothetical protein